MTLFASCWTLKKRIVILAEEAGIHTIPNLMRPAEGIETNFMGGYARSFLASFISARPAEGITIPANNYANQTLCISLAGVQLPMLAKDSPALDYI
jgi:hypothetical protein